MSPWLKTGMNLGIKFLAISAAIDIGDILYQYIQDTPNWLDCMQRMWFQSSALLIAWLVFWVDEA